MISNALYLLLGQGFLLIASVNVVVGLQNLFILSQAVRRQHLFAIAATCTLCDLLLLTLGLAGVATSISQNELFQSLALWLGLGFLLYYGSRSLFAACTTSSLLTEASATPGNSLRSALAMTVAVTLFNPVTLLSMVTLIGSVSSRYPFHDRLYFGVGALCASALWFFGLTYGAARVAPCLRHPRMGRLLDFSSGVLMWGLAGSMFWQ
jgi:L-lysine exporter family protein LysE/ArgO